MSSFLSGSENDNDDDTPKVLGAKAWNVKSRKAYGIATSLYDQHPINGKISGWSQSSGGIG
jgi:hypothetical protein